ncbi:MAG: extensin family protein [Devosia sp.]
MGKRAASWLLPLLAATLLWGAAGATVPKPNPLRTQVPQPAPQVQPAPQAPPAPQAAAVPEVAPVAVPRAKPAPPPRRRLRTRTETVRSQGVLTRDLDRAGRAKCEADLKRLKVTFQRAKSISSGVCGARHPLTVTAIDGVTLTPAATLRCAVARATAQWVHDVVQPAARRHLRTQVTGIGVAASYACRARRNGRTGRRRMSEHAYANAIDVGRLVLKGGTVVPVKGRPPGAGAQRAFQADIRKGACGRFTTVLGPGSDSAHSNHFHFDLAPRRAGRAFCR